MGIEAGVNFVTGEDFGLREMPHGGNARELAVYGGDLGLAVLRWATSHGAAMAAIPDLGRVAPGQLADLIVVDGDPPERIAVLAEPDRFALVMKGGCIAKSMISAAAGPASFDRLAAG